MCIKNQFMFKKIDLILSQTFIQPIEIFPFQLGIILIGHSILSFKNKTTFHFISCAIEREFGKKHMIATRIT